jgi:MFS transporter, CP family, cyanate transporter
MSSASPQPIATGDGASIGVGAPASATLPGKAVSLSRPLGKWMGRLAVVAVIVTAVNLRPAVTSIGPVLQEVRRGLGMSSTVAGLLASVPPLCFGIFGFGAPRLEGRFGRGRVVLAGMGALTVGLALRPLASNTALFLAASVLALAGLGVANVMMPVVVKHYFPSRVGFMTGVYGMGISLGTTIGAAATAPISNALGGDWRLALWAWTLPAALTIPCWLPFLRDRVLQPSTGPGGRDDGVVHPCTPMPATDGPSPWRLAHSRTARAMAVFFGLQASEIFCSMGWLPQIFRDAHVSSDIAGLLLALAMAIGVPVSLVLPTVAGKIRSQGILVVGLAVFGLAGFAGLWLAPAALPWVWAFLIGVACTSFPLALVMIALRARTEDGLVQLSAFAQCVGYLLSVPGPILVGVLHQYTGGWSVPIAFMAAMLVPQTISGVLAGRNRIIEDEIEISSAAASEPRTVRTGGQT